MESSRFRVFAPPEALGADVECFLLIDELPVKAEAKINVFSNGLPGIVFHHRDGQPAMQSIVTQSGRKAFPPTLFLYGPGTESSVLNFARGPYSVLQAVLKPHALKSLFGINALALKDAAVELNEFSKEDLNEQLMYSASPQDQLRLLTQFLIGKLNEGRIRDELIEQSVHLIHQHAGSITVRGLLEFLDISERHFERRFSETVGMPPLSYIRVRRFNESIRLMRSGQYETLTEIAHALRFHDQSHFIREMKTFTGITPKSLSQRVDELFHNQAGYSYL